MRRTDILLELLAAPGVKGSDAPIVGTTRLQKLLFLLEQEEGIKVTEGDDFDFTAYKFGPVSKEIYDDLIKLENLDFITSKPVAEPSDEERDEFAFPVDDDLFHGAHRRIAPAERSGEETADAGDVRGGDMVLHGELGEAGKELVASAEGDFECSGRGDVLSFHVWGLAGDGGRGANVAFRERLLLRRRLRLLGARRKRSGKGDRSGQAEKKQAGAANCGVHVRLLDRSFHRACLGA